MAVGIRTEGLRKVYTSPPAVGGARGPGGSKKAKTTYEVVALDGLTLEVRLGFFDALFMAIGLRQFRHKALT